MSELNTGKFDNFYNLLSLHDFAKNMDISEDLICSKCSRILANACQAPCGCRYCQKCIDELLNNCDICPGNTEFCKEEPLSNYHTDYRCNKNILKLVVKCPEELCQYECEMINMEEHLRLCSDKFVECPFYGLGCGKDKLVVDKIGDHLQLEGYNHNKILIGMFEILKNEVNELKRKVEKYEQEIHRNHDIIEIFTEQSRIKDETIVEMNGEIQSNKNQIKILKEENHQMAAEMNNLKIDFEDKFINLRTEITEELKDNTSSEAISTSDEMDRYQSQVVSRTEIVPDWLHEVSDATFSWKFDKISKRRQKHSSTASPQFSTRNLLCRMQLALKIYPVSDKVDVYLLNCRISDLLGKTFQGNVTIQISNNSHPYASKTVTKYCSIAHPNGNPPNWSGPFKFSNAELTAAGLMQDDYLIVNCYIK